MKEVERVGLLKMDFLGLSTLTLIDDCLDEIKRTEGVDLDIDAIPLDDAKTYKLFCDGQTYGVFQFESSGMRELLRKAKPERLDDLIALNALYRPGPLKSGMVDDFIVAQAGQDRGQVRADRSSSRSSPTPTASSPTRNRSCASPRCWPGSRWASPTCCARPWARRTRRSWPSSARPSWPARGQGDQREEGHEDLRPDGVLRRLRLQQVALDDLRLGRLPDGVPEGELPAALHGGAADDRSGEHRQAGDVPRRVPRSRRADPAARHQRPASSRSR